MKTVRKIDWTFLIGTAALLAAAYFVIGLFRYMTIVLAN